MPDVLTGTIVNATTPLGAVVSSISNNGSGEYRVRTATPHLYGQNDSVYVQAGTSDIALGTYPIIVIDAQTFDLEGSTFAGTASTGLAFDLSLTPQVLVPTDGDTFSAQLSGLLSSQQAILDRTQYIWARTGTASMAFMLDASNGGTPNVRQPGRAPNTVNGLAITCGNGSFVDATNTGFGTLLALSGLTLHPGDYAPNDTFEVEFASTVSPGGNASLAAVALFAQVGSNPITMAASSWEAAIASGAYQSVRVRGVGFILDYGAPGPADTVQFFLAAWSSSGNPVLTFYGDYALTLKLWRPTGLPVAVPI